MLAQISYLESAKVLDFGCGLGDFGYYLNKNFTNLKYTGIDINSRLIQRGLRKHPNLNLIEMTHINLPENSFDFVFASGVFNFNQGSLKKTEEYLFENLKQLIYLAKKGVAFNILTSNNQNNDVIQFDALSIYERCKQLSKHLVIREDYLYNDATIYIYL